MRSLFDDEDWPLRGSVSDCDNTEVSMPVARAWIASTEDGISPELLLEAITLTSEGMGTLTTAVSSPLNGKLAPSEVPADEEGVSSPGDCCLPLLPIKFFFQ